ncbi:MAG TPA: ATP-binding protein [Castellaniella sp.]|uniref:ATP-binding protein n=1 Tax=Castellaniella sp. TaxID=1955812 RepID=UPI002F17DD39
MKTTWPQRLRIFRHWRWALAIIACLPLILAAGRWSWDQEVQATEARVRQSSEAYVLALRGIVERYSDLPYVADQQPEVKALLLTPTAQRASAVNHYLGDLQRRTGAQALYVTDTHGLTLAASNWNTSDSFIDHSYHQRPYIEAALRGQRGLFYGVGLTTGKPGLFIAEPVQDDGRIIGVSVVKLALTPLEQAWSGDRDPVVLQDHRGIVFLSSVPAWLYHSSKPIALADVQEMNAQGQYGAKSHFNRLPWVLTQESDVPGLSLRTRLGGQRKDFLAMQTALPELGWTLTVTGDLNKAEQAQQKAQVITALFAAVLLLAILYWRQRKRRRALQQQALLEQEQREQERQLQVSVRLASVGEMASTLAHELNQPLMALSNFAVAARSMMEQDRTELLGAALDGIVEQSTRASEIVGRARAFINPARAQYGPQDIHACIVHVLDMLRAELQRNEIHIRLRFAPGLAPVRGDRVLLEQVLVNLIQNAVQIMQSTEPAQREITLATRMTDTLAEILVADCGPGIPSAKADQIFTPFFTTRSDGLGLGLNICRTIIEAHGGQLTARNRPEGGAAFIFTLPFDT